jgi:hypothetical protein
MNKNSVFLFSTLALASSLQFASAGDVTGKVTLKGTPPPEKTIEMDATCGKMHPGPVTTRHYVVGAGGGLANVFVYLKDAKAGGTPGPESTLDQVGCVYEPYVIGAMAGQKFKIKNSDPFLHNVHATPKNNPEFNLGQPTQGQVSEKSFEKPEVLVRMKCDVHAWMFSYVGVTDHPYFAVTDKDGNYKIANVPAGDYTIVAFHQKSHTAAGKGVEEKVKVDAGGAKSDLTVEVPAAK